MAKQFDKDAVHSVFMIFFSAEAEMIQQNSPLTVLEHLNRKPL